VGVLAPVVKLFTTFVPLNVIAVAASAVRVVLVMIPVWFINPAAVSVTEVPETAPPPVISPLVVVIPTPLPPFTVAPIAKVTLLLRYRPPVMEEAPRFVTVVAKGVPDAPKLDVPLTVRVVAVMEPPPPDAAVIPLTLTSFPVALTVPSILRVVPEIPTAVELTVKVPPPKSRPFVAAVPIISEAPVAVKSVVIKVPVVRLTVAVPVTIKEVVVREKVAKFRLVPFPMVSDPIAAGAAVITGKIVTVCDVLLASVQVVKICTSSLPPGRAPHESL
jgi:hypothetical protein